MTIHKKSILTVLLLFLFVRGTYASHISGAEISYKHLFANTYQFTLKVYRDCRECKFNNIGGGDNTIPCNEVPNLNIKGALGTSYENTPTLGTVEMQRKSINDLSAACYNSVSKCRSGSNAQLGYEVHVFEGTYDFSSNLNKGYCKLDVSIMISSRNMLYNLSNFFNFATINLCEGLVNSSTEFRSAPNFAHVINQSQFQSLGLLNPDGDSLAFSLKPALSNRTTNVIYQGGQSADAPFTYYCNPANGGPPCTPNIISQQVEGFYISKNTGDIAFTPTMVNQGGTIVVECEEWKKNAAGNYFLAGVTRRDVYSDVINLNNNLPRIKNRVFEYTICEGETLRIDMDLEDLPYSGLQFDSVTLDMQTSLKSASLVKFPGNAPPYNFYAINLGKTAGQSGTHYITVYAEDNNCPLKGRSSRTFIIHVMKNREIKINTAVKNCGMLDVSPANNINKNIYWTIRDINQNILKQQLSKKTSVQLPSGGKYIINAFLPAEQGYCEVNALDTIDVKNFSKPVLDMGTDYSVCANTPATIQPERLTTFNTYQVVANGEQVSFPYKLKINGTVNIKVRVTQDDGCFAEDNLMVQSFPVLKYKVSNDTICLNEQFPRQIQNIKANAADVNYLNLVGTNSNSKLSGSKTDWKISLVNPVSHTTTIYSEMQDRYMCIYKDTFHISLVEPEPITVSAPSRMCINSETIQLPIKDNGYWTCVNYPDRVKNNKLFPDRNNKATLNLLYTEEKQCKNAKAFTVAVMDTTEVTFGHDRSMNLCENTPSFELKGLPAGGTWIGVNVVGRTFYTAQAVGQSTPLTYVYRNANNCYSRDYISIFVDSMPKLRVKPDNFISCVGKTLGLQALTAFGGKGYWYTDGQGQFDNINSFVTNYQPNASDVQKNNIRFIYTIQTNGVCGNVSSEALVKIINGPEGEILKTRETHLCEPANLVFKSTFKDIDKQYWYINDSLVDEFDYNFNLDAVLTAGEYIIKTKVYNNSCEALAISENIVVLPKPHVKIAANPSFKLSREYPRLWLRDVSDAKYGHTGRWYLDNQWISDSRELYFKVDDSKDSFYVKLVATSDKGGCMDSAEQLFIFIPINQLYIPDAFSPDAKGPQENNVFKVIGPTMKNYEIEIFNRFGQKVFVSNDMSIAWDGTYMSKMCIPGVYFYKIVTTDVEDISRDYSGTVTIIR